MQKTSPTVLYVFIVAHFKRYIDIESLGMQLQQRVIRKSRSSDTTSGVVRRSTHEDNCPAGVLRAFGDTWTVEKMEET